MDVEIQKLISEEISQAGHTRPRLFEDCSRFLSDNLFFGAPWENRSGTLTVPVLYERDLRRRLALYLVGDGKTRQEKLILLKEELAQRLPATMNHLAEFQKTCTGPLTEDIYPLYDFMAAYLTKEVNLMTNSELNSFATMLDASASKKAVESFAFFTAWLKHTQVTVYTVEIRVKKRADSSATDAMDMNTICQMFFFYFNESVITEKSMLVKACLERRYADTLLYICIHLLCSLRDTDIERLPRPQVSSPKDILASIQKGTLTDEEAVEAIRSIMDHLYRINPVPNKTSDSEMVDSLYLFIPPSVEAYMGKLFLICEAHLLASETEEDVFLSARATGYWDLLEMMGPEAAEPFLERDICPTAFSKSFMQGLALMATQEGEGSSLERAMLAYQMAARARSHKGGFGSFAETTTIYLRDNSLTGLNASMIACELFERGILSNIPSMLLSLVSQGTFETIPFTQQTKLIQGLGLDAIEVEQVMQTFMEARARSMAVIQDVLGKPDKERQSEIRKYLHNLAAGVASGKEEGTLCFMTALNKPCPYPCLTGCLSCRYRIDTRTTLSQLGGEYKRAKRLMEDASCQGEQLKYNLILNQYLVPAIADALSAADQEFGSKGMDFMEMVINESAGFNDNE